MDVATGRGLLVGEYKETKWQWKKYKTKFFQKIDLFGEIVLDKELSPGLQAEMVASQTAQEGRTHTCPTATIPSDVPAEAQMTPRAVGWHSVPPGGIKPSW